MKCDTCKATVPIIFLAMRDAISSVGAPGTAWMCIRCIRALIDTDVDKQESELTWKEELR